MTTIKQLRLGFGLLTALLTVSVGAVLVLLIIIQQQMHEMATVTRPRAAVTRELELNILGFAVGVHHYVQAGDSAIWREVQRDAGEVDRYMVEYESLAHTGAQREMAARLAALWHEFRAVGHALMERQPAPAYDAELTGFGNRRLVLEQFLDNTIQPNAVAAFDANGAAVRQTLVVSILTSIALLVLGLAIAFATSRSVTVVIGRAEAANIKERNQLESTFQAMQDGVALFDMDGNLVRLNQALATINGFPSPAAMRQSLPYFARIYELFDSNGTPLPVEQWPVSRVLRGETVEDWELRGRRRDTQQEWYFSFSGTPVKDEQGKQALAIIVTRDITDRKRAEGQLRQAQKMEAVGQLTGGIAHDFNNILTVVIANAEVMAGALPADAPVREDLAELLAAAKRGATMIARLLQFSRRGMLAMAPVRPGAVVDDLGTMLRRLLPETVRLELVDATGEAGVVLADTGALEQVLINLCTNARDAMPEGGTLRIECENTWLDEGYHGTHPWVTPGAYVCIAVTDSGTGMDAETKQKLFEPFFTTKPASEGTGLGMAMVYGLMKQHNGMVHVYSEPGRGTTIKLYFPAVSEAATEAAAPRRANDAKQVAGGTEMILLAEDEAAIRRTTKRALERKGYTVLVAEDGEVALERYRQNKDKVALVISDLVMPRLGGRQVAEALRQEGSQVPILFTSGYSPMSASRTTGLPAGVEFLQKPWTLADLFARVRALLDG